MDGELVFRLLGGLRAVRVAPGSPPAAGAAGSVGSAGSAGSVGSAEVDLDLGGPQPRRPLAALLLSLDRPLPIDRLIHLVWGDEAPASARGSIQVHVSNLRKALAGADTAGSAVIALRSGGYQLVADRTQLDLAAFDRDVVLGAEEASRGRPAAAAERLAGALDRWAPLLPELADVPFVRAEAERLEARRQAAFELLQTARIDAGSHHEAIADLRRALAEDPRAERLWGLLALARYRSGQPAAAIDTVHQARAALRDATGLDLGPELQRLEADLYAQAPSLDRRLTAADHPAAAPSPGRAAISRSARCRRASRRGAPGGVHLRRP